MFSCMAWMATAFTFVASICFIVYLMLRTGLWRCLGAVCVCARADAKCKNTSKSKSLLWRLFTMNKVIRDNSLPVSSETLLIAADALWSCVCVCVYTPSHSYSCIVNRTVTYFLLDNYSKWAFLFQYPCIPSALWLVIWEETKWASTCEAKVQREKQNLRWRNIHRTSLAWTRLCVFVCVADWGSHASAPGRVEPCWGPEPSFCSTTLHSSAGPTAPSSTALPGFRASHFASQMNLTCTCRRLTGPLPLAN